MYNFMSIILEAQVSFICFAFMHSFQKFVSDFGDFQTLHVLEDTVIEKALHANESVR